MVEEQIPKPYTFPYETIGQRVSYVDVYLPIAPLKQPLHVILYFHGGGLTAGNRKSWFPRWIYDRAMRHGYAFISADYVLMAPATGHDVLEDIKDLFQYLHKVVNRDLITSGSNVTIDATSLIVSGSSAGGLCAYLAALHASPKPKGVLSLYGEGGDFLSPQYLTIKTEPFFRGREILDPNAFREFLYPFPSHLRPITDSPLKYYPADHPSTPGWPASLRMPLCRLYLQLGVYLDYFTGEHEPSLSAQLRSVLEEGHSDPETLTARLRALIPAKHIPLFPQFLIDSSFPPAYLIHGDQDSAVHSRESYNMACLLSSCGVENTLRIVEGEEHSFDYAHGAKEKHTALYNDTFEFIRDILSRD